MAGFGLFGSKKKRKKKANVADVADAVDATGYTKKQKQALTSGGKHVKALSAIDKRRKAMAEIMGN